MNQKITRNLLLAILVLFVSCSDSKNTKPVVLESAPATQQKGKISFKKITFSIYPGWSRERNSKDVEINEDGTIYYRLRDSWNIIENYQTSFDSVGIAKVVTILDSINFNGLKRESADEEDAPYHSLHFEMPNGSVYIKGTLSDEFAR